MGKPLRISATGKLIKDQLKDLDMEHFENWFFNESTQTVVGSATFTEYFMHLDNLKKNGNKPR